MQKLFLPILIITCVLGILLMRYGFIFILISMLPSIMAYYMRSDAMNSAFKTVLCCNLAGALPYAVPMVEAALLFEPYDIIPVVSSPEVWLVIYGAAAIGWCLMYLSRFIARFILAIVYDYRVVALEKMQKKLIAEWGARLEQHTISE